MAAAGLQACAEQPIAETTEATDTAAEAAPVDGVGALAFRANGEDFVRQGFTSKDGWEISFDHVYVSLAKLTAYQTEPPFDATADATAAGDLSAKAQVGVGSSMVVDLAAGDADAEPVLIKTVEAPAGRYNALSWEMTPADAGPAQGYSLLMQGTATKDGETLPFAIGVDETLAFTCGDFVGDDRKGIVAAGETADVEATFHFDHLFGDGDAPMDDDINTGALGFGPLAALAENGVVQLDGAALKAKLSTADYATLLGILPSLGHVGEGHCAETNLTATLTP
jgi:hypothetical protein